MMEVNLKKPGSFPELPFLAGTDNAYPVGGKPTWVHQNFIEAVEAICQNDDTLVVTLDSTTLMSSRVSTRLLNAIADGTDLVHGVMFRPDKPLHFYEPDYDN